jgi:hypothetical protein
MSNIQFKKKSDVQLNGRIEDMISLDTYSSEVKEEFKYRYDKIKEDYEKLMDEVYWNSIIYNKDECELKFKPIVNRLYYLYKKDNGGYFMSIISPSEWNKESIGKFRFLYNGKWIKE